MFERYSFDKETDGYIQNTLNENINAICNKIDIKNIDRKQMILLIKLHEKNLLDKSISNLMSDIKHDLVLLGYLDKVNGVSRLEYPLD